MPQDSKHTKLSADKTRQDSSGLLLRCADAAIEMQRLRASLDDARKENEELEDKLEEAQDEVQELQSAAAIAAAELKSDKARADSAEGRACAAEARLRELHAELVTVQRDKASMTARYESRIGGAATEVQGKGQELEALRTEKAELDVRAQETEIRRLTAARTATDLGVENTRLKQELAEALGKCGERQREVTRLERQGQALSKQVLRDKTNAESNKKKRSRDERTPNEEMMQVSQLLYSLCPCMVIIQHSRHCNKRGER